MYFKYFNAFNYYYIPYWIRINGYFRIFIILNVIIGAITVLWVLPNEISVLMEA